MQERGQLVGFLLEPLGQDRDQAVAKIGGHLRHSGFQSFQTAMIEGVNFAWRVGDNGSRPPGIQKKPISPTTLPLTILR